MNKSTDEVELFKCTTKSAKFTRVPNKNIEYVNKLEETLANHSLSIYPHLEECLPPDLFEEVMEIVDPRIKLSLNEECFDPERLDDFSDIYQFKIENYLAKSSEVKKKKKTRFNTETMDEKDQNEIEFEMRKEEESKLANPYRSFLKIGNKSENKKVKFNKSTDRKASLPTGKAESNEITARFCKWLLSLGGDEHNLDVKTIAGFFSSGYNIKPQLSLPIKFMDDEDVPVEIRGKIITPPEEYVLISSTNVPGNTTANKSPIREKPSTTSFFPLTAETREKSKAKNWCTAGDVIKKRERVNLENLHYFKHSTSGPNDEEHNEIKMKIKELDLELSVMNGTKLFLQYAKTKKVKIPEFLENVETLQKQPENVRE